jgi:hypothetical protein
MALGQLTSLMVPRATRKMPIAVPPANATRPPRRVSQLPNRWTVASVDSGLIAYASRGSSSN